MDTLNSIYKNLYTPYIENMLLSGTQHTDVWKTAALRLDAKYNADFMDKLFSVGLDKYLKDHKDSEGNNIPVNIPDDIGVTAEEFNYTAYSHRETVRRILYLYLNYQQIQSESEQLILEIDPTKERVVSYVFSGIARDMGYAGHDFREESLSTNELENLFKLIHNSPLKQSFITTNAYEILMSQNPDSIL